MDEYVVDEMKKIHEAYDLIIVTASFPEAVVDIWNWIQKYLPFIPYDNFISATRKDLINADLLIDDAVHNIRDWSKKGKPAISILHHWNHEVTSYPNVYTRSGWKGMKEYVDSILN
ncbi:hypothetical protein QO179_23645 [Bacillus stercoris]|nr:hypothetical protein [Bacillus stercoris]